MALVRKVSPLSPFDVVVVVVVHRGRHRGRHHEREYFWQYLLSTLQN